MLLKDIFFTAVFDSHRRGVTCDYFAQGHTDCSGMLWARINHMTLRAHDQIR